MAGTDYSLRIIVNADDRASGALRGIHGVLGQLGGGLQTLGTVALGGLGALAGAAAGAGAALAHLAIDAAPLEGIRGAFAALAESAGTSADEMLAALEQSSAGMISQRDLMLSFNRASQLVGMDFAQRLPDAMQYLGRVAAATGTDLDYLLNSLVVGVGRLSPMILDNLGIQVSLNDAYEEYAQSIGKSADQLTKQEQQAALMNAVIARLRENTASLPPVAGTAQASWAALGATWQNLRDELGVRLVPALQTVLTTISDLARRYLPPLIDAFQTYVVPVMEVAAAAFSAFFDSLAEGQSPLDALRNALATFLPPEALAAFDNIVAKAEEFWAAIRPIVDAVVDWVTNNVNLNDVLIALGVAIGVAIAALAPAAGTFLEIVGVFLAVVAAVSLLRTAWENDFLGIRTALESAWAAIQPALQAAWLWLQTTIPAALEWLRSQWETVWDAVQQVVNAVWPIIRAVYDAFRAAFEGDWYQFGAKLREAWDRAWELIKNVVRGVRDWLRSFIPQLIGTVTSFFRDTDWGSVGRSIIEGIANGIRAAGQWLVDAAVGAARAALDAARGFLGIHSPSAVFAEVGRQMMAGMAEGIRVGVRLPEARLGAAARQTAAAAAGSWQAVTIHHMTIQASDAGDLLRQLRALSGGVAG